MKDNYERLREEYLNICDEDCGGFGRVPERAACSILPVQCWRGML